LSEHFEFQLQFNNEESKLGEQDEYLDEEMSEIE